MSLGSLRATQIESHRLPNNTSPESYFINLKFDEIDELHTNFEGSVFIIIRVHEDTSVITLHTAVLINGVYLTKFVNGEKIEVAQKYDVDAVRQFLLIETLEESIREESVLELKIEFSGKISRETQNGVFLGSYLNGNDEVSYYVATHTKPYFARRIFPCYDEPNIKSRFSLTLQHSGQFMALSSVGLRGGKVTHDTFNAHKITVFDQNERLMSTFRIAFVMFLSLDFGASEFTTQSGISLRVLGKPQELLADGNAIFALKMTERVLEVFTELFEIPFQLGALDQVALPHYARCGDAESFGIALCRENCLLHHSNVDDKERAVLAIANTVCHQYLGNLLTPSWRSTSLWIPEGLCRFYEYHISEKVHPTIVLEGLFSATTMESALQRDLLSTTLDQHHHHHPFQAEQAFGDFYSNRSASIFRMIFHTLSEMTFTEGLKTFLKEAVRNPLGVTEMEHLYDNWQHAAEMSKDNDSNYKIADLFDSWERQEGYPLLFVERSYNDHRVRFTQNKFTSHGEVYDALWHIPITYAIENEQQQQFIAPLKCLLSTRQQEIQIDDLRPLSYLLVNVDRVGYYRVHYDEANWMLIAKALTHGNHNLSPISRAMLLSDASEFFMSKILNVRIYLELLSHLRKSVDYIPWLVATTTTNNLVYMRRMLDNDGELSYDFKKFLQTLLENLYSTYSLEKIPPDEPNYHKNIRNIAIDWSCRVHLNSCLKSTQQVMRQFKEDTAVLSVDHGEVTLCNGLILATKHDFEFMWQLHSKSDDDLERKKFYLKVIGCIEDEEILMEFMMRMFESRDEWQEILRATYSRHQIGLRVTLDFLRRNYEDIIELLLHLDALSSLNEIFRDIATRVNDNTMSSTLSDLLTIYNADVITREEVHSIVHENLLWLDTHTPNIRRFLNDFHNAAASLLPLTAFSYLAITFGLASNWIILRCALRQLS